MMNRADTSSFMQRTLGASLVAVWPNLRYFSLGILQAWLFLVVDYGGWMTKTDSVNLSVIDVGMHVYISAAVVLILCACLRSYVERLYKKRFMGLVIAGIAVIGVGLLIASGPSFLRLMSFSALLFQIGSITVGVAFALMTLWVGRLYCELEPSKAFLYAAVSEVIVAIIFYIVVGNSWLMVIPGAPPLVNLLSVICLPLVVMALVKLPEPQDAVESQAENGSGVNAEHAPTVSLIDYIRSYPVMGKLMVAVFVLSAAASIMRNYFMLGQPPDVHQLNFQQAMFLRFIFASLLLLAAILLTKKVALGKLYFFSMAALALVVAALPLLHLDSSLPLVFTSALSSMNALIIWCLLSFIAKSGGFSAFSIFGLGEGLLCAGLGIGYACGFNNVFAALGATDTGIGTPLAVFLIGIIIASVVLVFTEKDFDAILESSGASSLNVRAVIMNKNKPRSKEDRPWRRACEIVGKRGMLSERELELMQELTLNRTPHEVASHLSITVSTVRTHTHKIYVKLNVHSRDELIALVKQEYEMLDQ